MNKIVLAVVATFVGLGVVVGLIVGTVYLTGGSHHTAAQQPHINVRVDPRIHVNPAPAPPPPPTQYVPVPAQPQPQQVVGDPWGVASAYTTDVSSGDYTDAWALLSPGMQNQIGGYSVFVATFTPIGFDNTAYVSESGDAVTFTFDLHNTNTGAYAFHTCTYTVDNGLITSSVG
jgi:hypothetical protein